MGYPFSIEGEIALSPAARPHLDAVQERVHGGLLGLQADEICVEGRRLSFSVDPVKKFFGFRRIGVIDGGEVEILGDGPRITYHLSTKQSLFILMAMPVVVGVLSAAQMKSPIGLVVFIVFGFGSFSVSYAIDRERMLSLLRGTSPIGPVLSSAGSSDALGLSVCPTCGAAYNDDDYEFGVEHYCEQCHNKLPST